MEPKPIHLTRGELIRLKANGSVGRTCQIFQLAAFGVAPFAGTIFFGANLHELLTVCEEHPINWFKGLAKLDFLEFASLKFQNGMSRLGLAKHFSVGIPKTSTHTANAWKKGQWFSSVFSKLRLTVLTFNNQMVMFNLDEDILLFFPFWPLLR